MQPDAVRERRVALSWDAMRALVVLVGCLSLTALRVSRRLRVAAFSSSDLTEMVPAGRAYLRWRIAAAIY